MIKRLVTPTPFSWTATPPPALEFPLLVIVPAINLPQSHFLATATAAAAAVYCDDELSYKTSIVVMMTIIGIRGEFNQLVMYMEKKGVVTII